MRRTYTINSALLILVMAFPIYSSAGLFSASLGIDIDIDTTIGLDDKTRALVAAFPKDVQDNIVQTLERSSPIVVDTAAQIVAKAREEGQCLFDGVFISGGEEVPRVFKKRVGRFKKMRLSLEKKRKKAGLGVPSRAIETYADIGVIFGKVHCATHERDSKHSAKHLNDAYALQGLYEWVSETCNDTLVTCYPRIRRHVGNKLNAAHPYSIPAQPDLNKFFDNTPDRVVKRFWAKVDLILYEDELFELWRIDRILDKGEAVRQSEVSEIMKDVLDIEVRSRNNLDYFDDLAKKKPSITSGFSAAKKRIEDTKVFADETLTYLDDMTKKLALRGNKPAGELNEFVNAKKSVDNILTLYPKALAHYQAQLKAHNARVAEKKRIEQERAEAERWRDRRQSGRKGEL